MKTKQLIMKIIQESSKLHEFNEDFEYKTNEVLASVKSFDLVKVGFLKYEVVNDGSLEKPLYAKSDNEAIKSFKELYKNNK